ncbi:MAG TPA: type II toxin-antitoxin system VapC family toxin [Terracidiphilus sp.]|nr:type II toxin-antitoxin system VapC family toxin [Terracidiphilus sp.]
MIVDSSAIIAILTREDDWMQFARALDASSDNRISAASFLETSIVLLKRRNPLMEAALDELILDAGIFIEPVTAEQARIARQAYRDYGRSSGHPANLNFGDCFSYALARTTREPILFKGNDFNHTDLRSVLDA